MAIARLGATSLDCDDPRALAEFYAALTDGEIIFAADNFVAVRTPGGTITTQRVDNHQPPTWPAPGVAKQVHLEFGVTSLEEAVAAAEGIGATVASEQPSPDSWRVMLDPAGHPFCLTTLIPAE